MVARSLHKYCPDDRDIGDVVRVRIDEVDRGPLDPTSYTAVVVDVTDRGEGGCRWYKVAGRSAVLEPHLLRHDLHDSALTASEAQLADSLERWREMPQVPVRTMARLESEFGGQGLLRCDCRLTCQTRRCKCRQAGRACGPSCHHGNNLCKNTRNANSAGEQSEGEQSEGGQSEDEDLIDSSPDKRARARGNRFKSIYRKPEDLFPDQWQVETLIDARRGKWGRIEFLVRWEGYGPEADSWERKADVSKDLVREYVQSGGHMP